MGSTEHPTANDSRQGRPRTRIRVGALVLLLLVGAVVAWIMFERLDEPAAPVTAATPFGPAVVSVAALSAHAAEAGHPVYWAGPIANRSLEFTQTADAKTYVRYLPKGVKPGDPRADFLVVATYPVEDAYDSLKSISSGREVEIPGGGIAAVSTGQAQSVHFAFPDAPYQGEVFDPSPKKSLAVATSGAIQPVS